MLASASRRFIFISASQLAGVHKMGFWKSMTYSVHRSFATSAFVCNKTISGSDDYFKVFCLDKTFDINVNELTSKFRALQNQWHPDKFANKTQEEQDAAARESSLINQAYRTLKDPLKRCLYLLELSGHSLKEGNTDSDPEFLMEIMEINERLANIESPEEMETIKTENQAIMERLSRTFATAYESGNFEEARKIAARMKYYANISAKVLHFERERGL